jgi:hypothetical protein
MQPKAPKWLDDIRRSAEFTRAATRGKAEGGVRSNPLTRAETL